MPHFHLFADDTATRFEIFGQLFEHKFLSNQAFFWYLLNNLQLLFFLLLLLRTCQLSVAYILLYPVYWTIIDSIWIVMPFKLWEDYKIILEISGIFGSIILGYLLKRRRSACRINTNSRITLHLFLCLLFIGIPILLNYLHEMPIQSEIDFFGIIISSKIVPDATSFVLVLLFKIFLFVVLLGLFFTINRWWKYSILLPILIIVFQLKTLISSKSEDIDTYEVFEAFPLLLVVLALLLFLSKSAYYNTQLKKLHRKTFSQLENNKDVILKNKMGTIKRKCNDALAYRTESLTELNKLKIELEKYLKEL